MNRSVIPDLWGWPAAENYRAPYPQWLKWRIKRLRVLVLAQRATWPLTDEERRERRLAKYERYRGSAKGWERTRRYNGGAKHAACVRRYRDWHPRTDASYQLGNGRWVHPVKVNPQTGEAVGPIVE